ncbi:MAG TPA: class I SAM-dependent methyltransferase [Rubrobacter sp.]|nr:class I SAM-dependent methyltransferase [Rubrobacter sp.]
MQRFWETVIEPIFEAMQPKIIMEIGSDQGGNTENLLEFCRKSGSTLHVIDPAPGYDVSEWQREHGEHLVFHKDLSLAALPSVEHFDAVLIDGDHNWYTVFNELKTIERLCDERSREFPLVMLHDIGWPYGRRDLYYDPDSIPEEHRKPYEKKGMLPGVESLLDKGGLNQHLHNAVRENAPRSGVLTAVEDFMEESDLQLELTRLPGIHGLGVLIPSQLIDSNAQLADFLEQLRFSPFVQRYIEGVEKARLENQIIQQEERVNHRRRLEEESQTLRKARQERKEAHQELKVTRQEAKEARQELKESRQALRAERQRLNQANREIERLAGWIEELDNGVSALLGSRQWKVGHALGELRRKTLRKSKDSTAVSHLEAVLQQFRAWRESRNPRSGDPPTDDHRHTTTTEQGDGERL